jgi:hypothetical protein
VPHYALAAASVSRVTHALQVVLEKHQASKALGPGCLSVLHMFAPRNIGLASAG